MRNTKARGGRRRVQLLRNWTKLPEDTTASILSRLRPIDVFRAQRVCAPWRRICNLRLTPDRIDLGNDLCEKAKTHRRCLRYWTNPGVESVVRQVVDRSAGNLVDINLNSQCPRVVVTDNLLKYIVQSSKRIKRLVLECRNDGITEAGLSSVSPELGMLEDLEIYLQPDFGRESYEKPLLLETLELVGRSCPLLRSFQLFAKYGQLCPAVWGFDAGSTRNDVARAIARTMHGLQHLTLKGNEMDEKGLEELLDSCPRLDSVDATDCFDLEFREELVGRCKHFKGFRQPDAYSDDEYSSDYEVDI